MVSGHKLIIDTFSEVYSLLKPFSDAEFWDFASHDPVPGSVYVLGRKQLIECLDKVRAMCVDPSYVMIFCNAAEGSNTLVEQCSRVLKIDDLIIQKRLRLISGGDLPAEYPHVIYDHFLCCILDYADNLLEMQRRPEIFQKTTKPYDFLFLNGRGRPHRKYLLERFRMLDLLDRSIYTYLDGRGSGSRLLSLRYHDNELMSTNNIIRPLPPQYEVPRYRSNKMPSNYQHQFAKNDVFGTEWGEIYLYANAYIDTYFSVVTETVFETPWSFRTEKIAKVLAMGHPWICAASYHWYRDFQKLGFKTFQHLIDERFDEIDDHQDRMERIVEVVRDLCQQDLGAFLAEAESICKYNQQHLIEFHTQHRQQFPDKFFQLIDQHG